MGSGFVNSLSAEEPGSRLPDGAEMMTNVSRFREDE
jgi:hypothetical protein